MTNKQQSHILQKKNSSVFSKREKIKTYSISLTQIFFMRREIFEKIEIDWNSVDSWKEVVSRNDEGLTKNSKFYATQAQPFIVYT